MNENTSKVRSRTTLILMLLVFTAPVILAWLVFFVFPEYQPTGTMNHGQLVTPVRPLSGFSLNDGKGGAIDHNALKGKWTYVYLADGACGQSCVQQLYKIRQVRLTQGKNIDRLQRLFLWNADGVSEAQRTELAAHFPGLIIAQLDQGQSSGLVEIFALGDDIAPLSAGRIYLVDPLGNLMMSYEADAEPRGIIKDLERLLKYTGLG